MPSKQAEAQAEVMAEAFVFNVESLVTRDYLDARLDARFAEQDARIDARFSDHDVKFAEQGNRIDVLTSDMNGKFRLVFWMLTALIGANAATFSMVYELSGRL